MLEATEIAQSVQLYFRVTKFRKWGGANLFNTRISKTNWRSLSIVRVPCCCYVTHYITTLLINNTSCNKQSSQINALAAKMPFFSRLSCSIKIYSLKPFWYKALIACVHCFELKVVSKPFFLSTWSIHSFIGTSLLLQCYFGIFRYTSPDI